MELYHLSEPMIAQFIYAQFLKGMRKVKGEFALMCLGYNIKRAKNLLGFDKMMELMMAGA